MGAAEQDPVTFDNPPVNEVSFSVQLGAPAVDEVGALADFWPMIREAFPNHQKQPPLPPIAEDFSAPRPGGPQPNIQFLAGPPPVRYWFVSQDETRLVQVQADRFIYNWRRLPGREDLPYPRFRSLWPEFEKNYRAFIDATGGGAATWCELTYVNHVEAPGGVGGAHGPLARILRAMNPSATSESSPPTEDTQFQQRFRILDPRNQEPVGRFYITALPAFRTEDLAPIYVITLLVRGRQENGTPEEISEFFKTGRGLIVNAFKESTTEDMHKIWGLHE